MRLHIQKDPSLVSQDLAQWITAYIESTLKINDRFTWALTGGNSPKMLYDLLSQAPYRDRIDWKRMHIFWGDERAVPFDDDRNNAKMCYEHLLNKVPIVSSQVYRMRTEIAPSESANEYEKILRNYFPEQGPTFDLVLSGMGEDGHTLSLFPGTAVIHERQRWADSFYLAPQQMFRITLTALVVNLATRILFLTFGNNKANALYQVLQGPPNPDLYPSQVIQPSHGSLDWFIDEAAASKLDADNS